jgi:DNA repair photolyase
MIKEINAKRILSYNKNPASWFGVKYNMNLYRGCEHQCIYCDSRSECYQIENFNDVLVKVNGVDLLRKELMKKRKKETIGTGSMSDPYTFAEKKYQLMRKALEVIAEHGFPVNIVTKSNLVLRDVEILQDINRIYASVVLTITTSDDDLAKKLEPYAPSPTDRLNALGILSTLGICTSIIITPVLPFIEDNQSNILSIIEKAKDQGVKHIIAWFGMTLRDRQRAYYYNKLDQHFPGLRHKYEKKFGNRYSCSASNVQKLNYVYNELCEKYGISTDMPSYEKKKSELQLSFLDKDYQKP